MVAEIGGRVALYPKTVSPSLYLREQNHPQAPSVRSQPLASLGIFALLFF